MEIPRDLISLFSEFAVGGVRYLVVGGHAVAAHGRPRSTKDVDIWLDSSRANIARACAALRAFGVPGAIVEALRDAKLDEIVWLGRAPLRIDLLQSLPALEFKAAWSRKLVVVVGGVEIQVLGKEDLIAPNPRAGCRSCSFFALGAGPGPDRLDYPEDRAETRLLLETLRNSGRRFRVLSHGPSLVGSSRSC